MAGELRRLSVAEHPLLVHEIWDSIVADQESLPMAEAQREELDKRLEACHAAPAEGSLWDEVKRKICADK